MGSGVSKLRDEIDALKDNQQENLSRIQQMEEKYNALLSDKNSKILELQNQLAEVTRKNQELMQQNSSLSDLKNANAILSNKILANPLTEKHILDLKNPAMQEISKMRIDEFVETLLQDKNINTKYLPDFVERQLYKNVFTILVSVLQHTFATCSFSLLGHQVNLSMVPTPLNAAAEKDTISIPLKEKDISDAASDSETTFTRDTQNDIKLVPKKF